MIEQISVFLENKAGRLAHVCRVLGEAEINIRALSIADTTDFGVLRLIVNHPSKAYQVLSKHNFAVRLDEVLALEVADVPGGLAGVLQKLAETEINVEYVYAFLGRASTNAIVILRVENPEKAGAVMGQAGLNLLEGEQVYAL